MKNKGMKTRRFASTLLSINGIKSSHIGESLIALLFWSSQSFFIATKYRNLCTIPPQKEKSSVSGRFLGMWELFLRIACLFQSYCPLFPLFFLNLDTVLPCVRCIFWQGVQSYKYCTEETNGRYSFWVRGISPWYSCTSSWSRQRDVPLLLVYMIWFDCFSFGVESKGRFFFLFQCSSMR